MNQNKRKPQSARSARPRVTRTRTDQTSPSFLPLCAVPRPPQVAQTLSSQRRISTPLSLHQTRSHSSDRSLSFTSSVLISPRLSRRSGSQHANQPQPRFPTLDSDELASKVREEVDGPMRIPMESNSCSLLPCISLPAYVTSISRAIALCS